MKSSHSRADIFNFPFVRSKRVSYLVFVLSGGYYCYFDEDVQPFTSSLILSIRLFLLHICIPISSSSLFLSLVSSFTVSTLPFLPHLADLISPFSYPYAFQYHCFHYCLLHYMNLFLHSNCICRCNFLLNLFCLSQSQNNLFWRRLGYIFLISISGLIVYIWFFNFLCTLIP